MLAIFGEDQSDFETLKAIVRVLRKDTGLKIGGKGYRGCGNLLNGCAWDIRVLLDQGYNQFLICHDADGKPPQEVSQTVMSRVVIPSGLTDNHCILIPVQEIEAWILADLPSATHIFKGWEPPEIPYPENITHPKEHLVRLSREGKPKPRYDHTTHNPRIANYLNYDRVKQKCPSFRPLLQFLGVDALR